MKTFTRVSTLVLFTAVIFGCISGFAQMPGGGGPPPGGPDGPMMSPMGGDQQTPREPNAKQFLSKFSKNLKLTDDQKSKIKPILEAQQSSIDRLEKSRASDSGQPQAIERVEQQSWAEIRPLLDPDQQKKFDVMTRKITEKHDRQAKEMDSDGNGGGSMGGPPPGPPR